MNDASPAVRAPPPDVVRRNLLLLLIALCCVGFFIADVMTPQVFDDAIPALTAMGIVTAQLTVICVWGTLVRGTFWIRLPWTLLLLVVSWCGFAWGIRVENRGPNPDAMLGLAVIWMLGFVTSFVPLKIAALGFRWQIIQDSTTQTRAERGSRYAIRDILVGTLLLAISMGIGRAMLAGEELSLLRAWEASGLAEPQLLILISIYGVVSLLVKLPCIWISLGAKPQRILRLIGVWVVYCFLLAAAEMAALIGLLGTPGGGSEVFTGIVISHQSMGAVMLSVCLALRGLGYRLERSVSPVA
ncbi:hypothetical protein [Roseimaritima sediminicola]|uniref:hypothetical protein n=1 Tax=Roseimaritima sediminicola TaxID=2662066 RepID=UPI00129843B1|nr:hypothetical protein [Roseimaritima sediminicola]